MTLPIKSTPRAVVQLKPSLMSVLGHAMVQLTMSESDMCWNQMIPEAVSKLISQLPFVTAALL
jgi:outer membrane lipopolysaccharide assembly protein LptE/RlpB